MTGAATAALLALVAGVGIALQALVNLELRQRLGQPALAALVSFLVGSAVLAVLALATFRGQPRVELAAVRGAPWWSWVGGAFGAYFVWSAIVATQRLGPMMFFALVVAGQLVASTVIEHHGWLGAARQEFTPMRAVGVALLLAGLFVLRWRP